MTEPIVIEPVMMKNIGDCGMACLAMLTGRPYAEVMAACPKRGKPQWNGLSTRQMQNVAKKLGFPLGYNDKPEDDEVGILDLDHAGEEGHYVVFAKGTLYNPAQGEWWTDVDSYLKRGSWIVAGFLWRKQ